MTLAPKPATAFRPDRIAPDRRRRNASRMAVTLAVLIGVALILLIGREALGFHARALRLSRDELAAEARRIDPGLQRGYGQRAQAAWSVPGRGTSPPIRG